MGLTQGVLNLFQRSVGIPDSREMLTLRFLLINAHPQFICACGWLLFCSHLSWEWDPAAHFLGEYSLAVARFFADHSRMSCPAHYSSGCQDSPILPAGLDYRPNTAITKTLQSRSLNYYTTKQ